MIVHKEIKNTRQDANPTTPIIGSLMKQLSVAFVACLLALFLVMPSVHAGTVPKLNPPTITEPIKSGAMVISGRGRMPKSSGVPRALVTVIVRDGTVIKQTKTSSASGNGVTWSVTLDYPVKKGYTVTAYQEYNKDDQKYYDETKYGGTRSDESAPVTVQPSIADNYDGKLKEPNIDEVYIEHTDSNQLNPDEKQEIIDAFMDANKDVVGENGRKFGEMEIEKVDVKIVTSTSPQKTTITVTLKKDKSILTFDATNIKYIQITEKSRTPEIETIYVVDNVIKGKISGEGPFNAKAKLVLKVGPGELGMYCDENKCTVDKDSSDPIDLNVDSEGKFSYTLTGSDTISLNQIVGVTVKEYRKFPSCRTKTVVLKTPEKVGVRDPKKLTDEEKAKIDKAIRDANTKNGVSKLPNGTGYWDGVSAVIQIDDSGNAKIFSGNDVAGNWPPENDYQFVPEKNEDGSYKIKEGAKPVGTIPAKDLVINIKPKSPAIAVDTDKGEVTITPPAYVNPGDDTDLASYTISYAGKTVTITRSVDKDTGKSTWSGTGVTPDTNTGVVTLEIKDLPVGATITTTAKDNGGLEGDTTPLESDSVTATLETVEVAYDANGGTGNMDSQTINKGVKYKLLPNGFTAPEGKKFDKWEVDGEQLAPGSEIKADSDIVVKAIWKDKDPNEPQDPSNPNDPQDPSNPNDPQDPNDPNNPNKPQDTDKVRIVAPQTGDVSILALCSPAILASVGMVALFRRRKEKR